MTIWPYASMLFMLKHYITFYFWFLTDSCGPFTFVVCCRYTVFLSFYMKHWKVFILHAEIPRWCKILFVFVLTGKRNSFYFRQLAEESLDSIFRLLNIVPMGSLDTFKYSDLHHLRIRLTEYSKVLLILESHLVIIALLIMFLSLRLGAFNALHLWYCLIFQTKKTEEELITILCKFFFNY